MIEQKPDTLSNSAPNSYRSALRHRLHLPRPMWRRHPHDTSIAPFTLRVSHIPHDNHLVVDAVSAVGQAEATSPFPDVASRDLSREVMAGDTRPWKIASRAGERLYQALFPPPIAALFRATVDAAPEVMVPIVLHIDDPRLAALPWELLRDPERERFLSLSVRTPVSRSTVADTTSGATTTPPLERGNLRVTWLADLVEERALRVTSAIGADARVDVRVSDAAGLATRAERPHVLILDVTDDEAPTIPSGIPLVVMAGIAGNGAKPPATGGGDRAEVMVPGTMHPEAQETFAVRLAAALADGQPLDAAVAAARRAVADAHSVAGLDWAEPVFVAAQPSRPLVAPERSAAVVAGAEVATKTVGWLRDAINGSISAVLFLIAGLLIYRLGFSTSDEIELDLLSPFELFSTFKGLILGLSTYQDTILLMVAGGLALVTTIVGATMIWRRRRLAVHAPNRVARAIGPLTSVRVLSFLTIATVTIFGAYLYQQYLWRVVLPIPDGALGIAITREAAAASIRDELSGVLFNQGQTGRIVVRDLPVAFDGRDTEKARELGKRIGAEAVLIYREIDRGDVGKQYSAYVVFSDPSEGLTIGDSTAAAPTASTEANPTVATDEPADELIQVREGVEIPALRSDTVAELVSSSAGVIAYNQNRFREAITLFEQALPDDPSDPNQGILNFYLGDSLRFDGQAEAAATVLERAITFYETRQSAAVKLTAEDEFILARAYFTRGWIAGDLESEGLESAIGWYDKALPLRDKLLARSGELERPFAARGLFARIFSHLAEANRRLDRPDEQLAWEQRALDELDLLAQEAPPNDAAVMSQEAGARFIVGDCVGAQRVLQNILSFDPEAQYAKMASGIVLLFQGRGDQAEQAWREVLAVHPDDASARESVSFRLTLRAFGDSAFFEPFYLEQAEAFWRSIQVEDPANEQAHVQIADSAALRAGGYLLDSTAQAQGDVLDLHKSQQLWPNDPSRRAQAIAALDIVIQERRILATEIHPDQPAAQVDLTGAYDERQRVQMDAFSSMFAGEPLDLSDPILSQAAEAVQDDAEEITSWTSRILAADSGATRVERLQAWKFAISSASRLWSLAVLREDLATAEAMVEERQRLLEGALVDAGTVPPATTDEALAIFAIYSEGYLLSYFAGDTAKQAEYQARMAEVIAANQTRQANEAVLDATICRADRDYQAGQDALATGDLNAARTHYDAAIAKDPAHVSALIARATLSVRQADAGSAVADATTATEIYAADPGAWSVRVQAHLAAGDDAAAEAALGQFLQVTSGLPPQERMIAIRDTIKRLASLVTSQPDRSASILALVPAIAADLDAMPADYARTYQYVQLYAELGDLALDAGDAVSAEPLLRRAVSIDPHQTPALANLAIAVLIQGRSATPEIDAAIVDTRDQVWQLDPDDPTVLPRQLLDVMTAQSEDYLTRFPDRAAVVQPLLDAIDTERDRLDAGS